MKLSVAIITLDEQSNIGRTLKSVCSIADEVVIVDSGSTDRTEEIARSFGEKVKWYAEPWKGFARQKNSAIKKCAGEWVLSLDADEEVSAELRDEILRVLAAPVADGYTVPRKNMFLGRWMRHGGEWPDRKTRLVKRELAAFEDRPVHEDIKLERTIPMRGPLIHYAYPTLTGYIAHMNSYSSLGAEVAAKKGRTSRSLPAFFFNVHVRPQLQFVYNYVFRGGFLDGREGFLFHWYRMSYASWKYAKAWEISRESRVAGRE